MERRDIEGTGPWSVDDDEAEALLAGHRSARADLASLETLLGEVRTPRQIVQPRPSEELIKLFAEDAAALAGLGRRAGMSRSSIRRTAKAAAVTTTVALAVTLGAAAQILPGSQTKAPVTVSGPATPVQLGASQSVSTPVAEARAGASITVPQAPTTALVHAPAVPPSTVADPGALSLDALLRLPFEALKTLSGENLARLPLEILRTLPGDTLARLPLDLLRTLPVDALARVPGDILRGLPGDVLARLPLDLLRTLPADAQSRLPADVLRLLSLSPAVMATTAATVRP